VPLLGFVRDTQNYVHLAAHGLTLWDVSSNRFERDIAQWRRSRPGSTPEPFNPRETLRMRSFDHITDLQALVGQTSASATGSP